MVKGTPGEIVVIEDRLFGFERSVTAITDGKTVYMLPFTQDYKREGDGDMGLNTGGMGAHTLSLSERAEAQLSQILRDVVAALAKEGCPYTGFIYLGFMYTPDGPMILECNCRLGDPEAQVILPSITGDFANLCMAAARGNLAEVSAPKQNKHALCIVLASATYPDSSVLKSSGSSTPQLRMPPQRSLGRFFLETKHKKYAIFQHIFNMSGTKLSIGIVGLPNVGKSTLFNALTEQSVPAENFPFCTIDPSVGVVAVPDERLGKLAEFSHSAKTIPAAVEFVDIAGLVKGAHEGEGLGNQFLSHIRETDAIAEVVRVFDDPDIGHVSGRVDPRDDIEVINLELIMSDLQTVSKRISNLERGVRSGDKEAITEHELCEKLLPVLESGKMAASIAFDERERKIARGLNLLTAKPILYVLNRKMGALNLEQKPEGSMDNRYEQLIKLFESINAQYVVVDAGAEAELSGVAGDEREQFRREFGLFDDGVKNLIRSGYELLDLITFFTTGEKETRGWQIAKGSTAPEAGAAIHSDFRDKFIRAEVVGYEKLVAAGSYAAARERGLIRTEGKGYVVKDGDVIEFKI
jgi:hypothetical protein